MFNRIWSKGVAPSNCLTSSGFIDVTATYENYPPNLALRDSKWNTDVNQNQNQNHTGPSAAAGVHISFAYTLMIPLVFLLVAWRWQKTLWSTLYLRYFKYNSIYKNQNGKLKVEIQIIFENNLLVFFCTWNLNSTFYLNMGDNFIDMQ